MGSFIRSLAGLLAAAALAAPAAANCYRVYDRGNVQLYGSQDPPVDLSRPLSETVPLRFGRGAVLVFTPDGRDCPQVDLQPVLPSPLLDASSMQRGGAPAMRAPRASRM